MASNIENGADAEFDERLKNIANFADKLEIALLRVISCIERSLTQFKLEGQSDAVS